MGYEKQSWGASSHVPDCRDCAQLEKRIEQERRNHEATKHEFNKKIIECDAAWAALKQIADAPLAPSPDDEDSIPTYTKVVDDYTKRVAIARAAIEQRTKGSEHI